MQLHKTNVFNIFQKYLPTLAMALSGPSGRCVLLSEVLRELSGRALGTLVGACGVLGTPSGHHHGVIGTVLGVLRVIWKSLKNHCF